MKTHCSNAQKWFLAFTLALLAFGELAYVLGICMDNWVYEWKAMVPEAVISRIFSRKHLLFVILGIAVCILLYNLLSHWKNHTAWPKRLSAVLGIILLVLNLLSAFALYCATEYDRDGIPESIDIHAEIQYIRSKSHWFGRGDHYYSYPDAWQGEDMTTEEYHEIRDIANGESIKAYYVFEQRSAPPLSILDYGYGMWVSGLYALVVVFWCVGALIGWKAVRGSWNRVLYGSCFLVLAAQVLGPLLEQFGVLIWVMPILFSDTDWLYWLACVVPQLTAMTFLLAGKEVNT